MVCFLNMSFVAVCGGIIQWREWSTFKGLLVPKNGNDCFGADFDHRYKPSRDPAYLRFQRDRMQDRISFLSSKRDEAHDMTNTFIAPLVSARLTIDRILDPDLYR